MQSLAAYSKGVDVAVRYLGPDHGITQTLQKSEQAAKSAMDATAARKKRTETSTQWLMPLSSYHPLIVALVVCLCAAVNPAALAVCVLLVFAERCLSSVHVRAGVCESCPVHACVPV